MEWALALLAVFAARYWVRKMPRAVKARLLFLFLALAGEQVVSYRQFAKGRSGRTIRKQHRVSGRPVGGTESARRSRADARIHRAMDEYVHPGAQFTGSSWSMAYNPVQQRAFDAAFNGGDTRREIRASR